MGGNTTSLTYDFENRVTGITYPNSSTNSFQYNGLGLRTQKVDSAGTFNYVCDGTTPASAVLSDSAAIYTPGLSERRSSTSKFYHGDALSSTRGVTNTSQTATDSKLFDAFGMTVSSSGSTPTPFGFVGGAQYQTDGDSGLMLLGHRYYDASVGRFISQDPVHDGDNWYAYCENGPTTTIDPEGTWRWLIDLALLLSSFGDIEKGKLIKLRRPPTQIKPKVSRKLPNPSGGSSPPEPPPNQSELGNKPGGSTGQPIRSGGSTGQPSSPGRSTGRPNSGRGSSIWPIIGGIIEGIGESLITLPIIIMPKEGWSFGPQIRA